MFVFSKINCDSVFISCYHGYTANYSYSIICSISLFTVGEAGQRHVSLI